MVRSKVLIPKAALFFLKVIEGVGLSEECCRERDCLGILAVGDSERESPLSASSSTSITFSSLAIAPGQRLSCKLGRIPLDDFSPITFIFFDSGWKISFVATVSAGLNTPWLVSKRF